MACKPVVTVDGSPVVLDCGGQLWKVIGQVEGRLLTAPIGITDLAAIIYRLRALSREGKIGKVEVNRRDWVTKAFLGGIARIVSGKVMRAALRAYHDLRREGVRVRFGRVLSTAWRLARESSDVLRGPEPEKVKEEVLKELGEARTL